MSDDQLCFEINLIQVRAIQNLYDDEEKWKNLTRLTSHSKKGIMILNIMKNDVHDFADDLKTYAHHDSHHGTKVSVGHLTNKMRLASKGKTVRKDGVRIGKKTTIINLEGYDPYGTYNTLEDRLTDLKKAGDESIWSGFGIGTEVTVSSIDGNKASIAWRGIDGGGFYNITVWLSNLECYSVEDKKKSKGLKCKCGQKLIVLGILGWCDNCKEHYEVTT